MIQAWNTVLFEKFCRFQHLIVENFMRHSDELLRRHPPRRGQRVLDIGCGAGDTTLELARRVGPHGSALGVDCAPNFIELARADAARAGLANARFQVADVQLDPLGGPYDAAFSRFGSMFFASPGAALRNIRRALVPGAHLDCIVWRRREDNLWLYEAETCARAIVPVVSHDQTRQVHCGPGPFSMADPDLVSDLLRASGYEQLAFERFDTDLCLGRDLDEAVEYGLELGPAGEILRLAGDAGRELRPQVQRAVREALQRYVRRGAHDGEVWVPSSTWFVRAVNPG